MFGKGIRERKKGGKDVHVTGNHFGGRVIVVLKELELGERMGQLRALLFSSFPLPFQFGACSLKLGLQFTNLIPQRLVLAHKLFSQLAQSRLLFLQSLNGSDIAMFCRLSVKCTRTARRRRRRQALTTLEASHEVRVFPHRAIHHLAFLLNHAQSQNQRSLARHNVLLACPRVCNERKSVLRRVMSARRGALYVCELRAACVEIVLCESELFIRTAQGEGEFGELQLGGVWRCIGVRTECGELCTCGGVLVLEHLSALDSHGGFERVPLQFECGCVCFML